MRQRCRPLSPACIWWRSDRIRNFDVDFEDRNFGATLHLNANAARIDFDVPADGCQNFLAQHDEKVGRTLRRSFMGKQNLQPIARNWSGSSPLE
jgi:hypothetical protein